MEKIISDIKTMAKFLGIILIFILILSLLNMLSSLSYKTIKTICVIFMILLFFITGFKQGKKSNIKGIFCGLKYGALGCLILFILSLCLFFKDLTFRMFLYYTILILTTMFGSIIGVNKKKEA